MASDENNKNNKPPPPLPSMPPPSLKTRRSNMMFNSATNNVTTTTTTTSYEQAQSSLPPEIPLKIVIDEKKSSSSNLNKFSSILITQLNENIRTIDDIDVKVISQQQTDLFNKLANDENEEIKRRRIMTNTEYASSEVYNNQSTIIEESTLYGNSQNVKCESIECQTDDVQFERYFSDLKPTFSDVESIGIYYFDANSNNFIISDDEAMTETNDDKSSLTGDDCVGYEIYQRTSNKFNRQPRSLLKYKAISTQTVLSILPDKTRSTQTSPSLLRDYVMSDLTNLLALADKKEFKMPTSEDLANKLKNEQKLLLVTKSRSNSSSASSNRDSINSENTSFEQPLCDSFDVKYAELCQDDDDDKLKTQPKHAESVKSLSDKSTSFYTVATHLTNNNTTTLSAQYNTANISNNNTSKLNEGSLDKEVLDNYCNNGQLVNLNRTLSHTESLSDEIDAKILGEGVQIQGAQSDRTSIISDYENREDIDYIDSGNLINGNDVITNLAVTGKILSELVSDQQDNLNFVEEKYVKDRYEIYYPQSDRIRVQHEAKIVNIPSETLQSDSSSTLISPNTARYSIDELNNEINYDTSKIVIEKPNIIEATIPATNKKTIKFNDELDIIDPSDYSTPTTSTSNIQIKLPDQVKVDNSSDDGESTSTTKNEKSDTDSNNTTYYYAFKWHAPEIEKSPDLDKPSNKNKIEFFKPDTSPSSPQISSSFVNKEANSWDNVPVKPYNSLINSKPLIKQQSLESNLQKTLYTFDMKESKARKGVKYVETSTSVEPTVANNGYSSDSLERRLRASGFSDFIISSPSKEKENQDKVESKPPRPSLNISETTGVSSIQSPLIRPPIKLPPPPIESPPPVPETSPPRTPSMENLPIISPPPERPPLPNLPLNNPLIPPRISQNTKFELNDHKITTETAKIGESTESLNETIQSQRSSHESSFTRNETEQIIQKTQSSSSLSNYKGAIIVDTIEETSVSTSIVTQTTVIKTEHIALSESSSLSDTTNKSLNEKQVEVFISDSNKFESESISINETSQNIPDRKTPLFNESKLSFDEQNVKKFDVDFTFNDEESINTTHEQTSQNEKNKDAEKPRERHTSLSNESKLTLDGSNIQKFNVDFGFYDEEQKIRTQVDEKNELINATNNTFTSEFTDVTNNTSRDHHSSLSNESKLLLNSSINFPRIDVDFSIYDETPSKNISTQIDEENKASTETIFESTSNKPSLAKESKIILDDKKSFQQFDIDFDEYDSKNQIKEQPKEITKVLVNDIVDRSRNNSSSKIISTTESSFNKAVTQTSEINNFLIKEKTKQPVVISSDSDAQSKIKLNNDSIDDQKPPSIRERKASLSNESKLLLKDSQIQQFDVNFDEYESPRPSLQQQELTNVIFSGIRTTSQNSINQNSSITEKLSNRSGSQTSEDRSRKPVQKFDYNDQNNNNYDSLDSRESGSTSDRKRSLSSSSKLLLETNKIKQFEVDLNEYESPKPTSQQQITGVLLSGIRKTSQNSMNESSSITESIDSNRQKTNKVIEKPNRPVIFFDNNNEKKEKFNYDAIDIPMMSSLNDRKKSLSSESKLLLENKKIQQFDIDFSIYDEVPSTKSNDSKSTNQIYSNNQSNIKLNNREILETKDYKSSAKKSVISLDKENSVKKFDIDFNDNGDYERYDMRGRRPINNENSFSDKRDKFKPLDNLIDYQSPNNSFNRSPGQTHVQKKPVNFVFQDWENMLNVVNQGEDNNDTKDNLSYNDDESDHDNNNDDDEDGAGTEADIDENDEQDNDLSIPRKPFSQNSNGIVNMVFEPTLNQAEIFNDQAFAKNHKNIHEVDSFENMISPKRIKNFEFEQNFANNPNFVLNDKDHKITVTSVAPIMPSNGRKGNEPFFTTHIERGEIKAENRYDAQIEVSGYNPPGTPRTSSTSNYKVNNIKPIDIKQNANFQDTSLAKVLPGNNTNTSSATKMYNNTPGKQLVSLKNNTNNEEDEDADLKKYSDLINRKRLRHQSGETSSIVTETSIDGALNDKNQYKLSNSKAENGKMSVMQKIMLNIADQEKVKLIKRVERRRVRVPEILELLKTAKGKQKQKLEDELKLLLRKADKDEQLLKKFNLEYMLESNDKPEKKQDDQTDFKIRKTKSQEMLDNDDDNEVRDINTRKSSLSVSASSLLRMPGSGSASGFSNVYNDGYSSAGGASTGSKHPRLTSLKGSGGARESGYSSCDESGTEFRHRRRYSSFGSESRLEKVEDDYYGQTEQLAEQNQNPSSMQTAIKSAVNKLPIDSSTFVIPSNSSSVRVLTKSPTLQLGYSNTPPAHKRIVFPPNSQQTIPFNSYNQQQNSSTEFVPNDLYQPLNVSVSSNNNRRRNDDYDLLENYSSQTTPNSIHSNAQILNMNNGTTYEDTQVRNTSIRPPIDNFMKSVTSNRDTNNQAQNDTKYQGTVNNGSTSNSSSKNTNKQVNQFNRSRQEDDDDEDDRQNRRGGNRNYRQQEQMQVRYIREEDLGPNYENTYNVELDRQTGELFILDLDNGIKYVIVKAQENKEQKRSRIDNETNQHVVEYITRSALDNIGGVEIQFDNRTGEQYIQDPSNANRRWIVLPDDWDESVNSEYVAAEDVDSMEWNVFVEADSNRKYIVDERNGRRYFIVPKITDKDIDRFLKQWAVLTGLVMRLNATATQQNEFNEAPKTIEKPASVSKNKTSGFQIKWPGSSNQNKQEDSIISQSNKKDPNLGQAQPNKTGKYETIKSLVRSKINQTNVNSLTVKDDETIVIPPQPQKPSTSTTKETKPGNIPARDDNDGDSKRFKELIVGYVEEFDLDEINDIPVFQDPVTDESYIQYPQTNRIWIILPPNWRNSGRYIAEEDLDGSDIDIYLDEFKRQFVVNNRTGKRCYIVPKITNVKETFKYQWSALGSLVQQYDNVVWRKELEDAKRKELEKTKPKDNRFKMPPFDSSLKSYPKNDNDNVEVIQNFDSEPGKLSPTHKSDIIIKQKGKMGHLIRTDTRGQLKTDSKSPKSSPTQRRNIPRALILPKSPRPLHHLLLEERLRYGMLKQFSDDYDKENQLTSSSTSTLTRNWRSSSLIDDPTASKRHSSDVGEGESPLLDRNKLVDIQINGYRKEPKTRRGGSLNSSYSRNISRSNPYLNNSGLASASGNLSYYSNDSPFLTGVLTERFKPEQLWKRNHRGVQPKTRLHLKEQILATPRAQERVWRDALNKSYKLKPRIIVINDDERIVAADKNCKVYIQYLYDHDSVLGADPAYLLMLPDRGPVHPTRPLMVTLKQLEEQGADIALREAPVFVYHRDGNAYFENIAQYLAGKYPKLSPKTVRKILQFSNMQEFENYLESKITRDKAKHISELSGDNLIDVDAVKNDLFNSLTPHSPILSTHTDHSHFYHQNCEYDSLRTENNPRASTISNSEELYETKEIELDGIILKSTFVSFTPTGDVERVEPENLPPSVIEAIKQADEYEHQVEVEKKIIDDRNSKQNRYIENPIISSIKSPTYHQGGQRQQYQQQQQQQYDERPTSSFARPIIPLSNNLKERFERFNSNASSN